MLVIGHTVSGIDSAGFITRLDQHGQSQWTRTFGARDSVSQLTDAIDLGDGYNVATGNFDSDFVIMKIAAMPSHVSTSRDRPMWLDLW